MRTHTPVAGLPALIGRNYGVLHSYLEELGLEPDGVPFTAYHDSDMADLDVAMGFPVPADLPARGDNQAGALPSGHAATCQRIGPYAEMSRTHADLFAWLPPAPGPSGVQLTSTAWSPLMTDTPRWHPLR
jgi:hypothetical protein